MKEVCMKVAIYWIGIFFVIGCGSSVEKRQLYPQGPQQNPPPFYSDGSSIDTSTSGTSTSSGSTTVLTNSSGTTTSTSTSTGTTTTTSTSTSTSDSSSTSTTTTNTAYNIYYYYASGKRNYFYSTTKYDSFEIHHFLGWDWSYGGVAFQTIASASSTYSSCTTQVRLCVQQSTTDASSGDRIRVPGFGPEAVYLTTDSSCEDDTDYDGGTLSGYLCSSSTGEASNELSVCSKTVDKDYFAEAPWQDAFYYYLKVFNVKTGGSSSCSSSTSYLHQLGYAPSGWSASN